MLAYVRSYVVSPHSIVSYTQFLPPVPCGFAESPLVPKSSSFLQISSNSLRPPQQCPIPSSCPSSVRFPPILSIPKSHPIPSLLLLCHRHPTCVRTYIQISSCFHSLQFHPVPAISLYVHSPTQFGTIPSPLQFPSIRSNYLISFYFLNSLPVSPMHVRTYIMHDVYPIEVPPIPNPIQSSLIPNA